MNSKRSACSAGPDVVADPVSGGHDHGSDGRFAAASDARRPRSRSGPLPSSARRRAISRADVAERAVTRAFPTFITGEDDGAVHAVDPTESTWDPSHVSMALEVLRHRLLRPPLRQDPRPRLRPRGGLQYGLRRRGDRHASPPTRRKLTRTALRSAPSGSTV